MERRERFARGALLGVCLLVLGGLSGAAGAADFAGGTGTWGDPYQIATAEQLIGIGADPNLGDKHFILTAHIDLDPNLSEDYAFHQPVIERFSGVFDGNGLSIRHLTIRDIPGEHYIVVGPALFGEIGYGGEVKDLTLEDVEIVAGPTSWKAGAICASNSGRVVRCVVTGCVFSDYDAGGLIGSNGGEVLQCSVSGRVSAEGNAGGVVASQADSGTVEESRALCTVSGGTSGGLIGRNDGDVHNCYARCDVSGERVGGLVGNHFSGTISRCYAACEVSATASHRGGLVGIQSLWGDVEVSQCHYLFSAGFSNRIGTWEFEWEMKEAARFVGWDFWGGGNDGLGVPWFMPENGYPELAWLALREIPEISGQALEEAQVTLEAAGIEVRDVEYDYDHAVMQGDVILARPCSELQPGLAVDLIVSMGVCDWASNSGAGEPNDPYRIHSIGELDCLAHEPLLWDRHFRVDADLDMGWRTYESSLIGRSDPSGMAFEGTFDGGGHIIRRLAIEARPGDQEGTAALGLFGWIGESGVVRDLGLTDVSIVGHKETWARAGMLCTINEGVVERCHTRGIVQGYGAFGGLLSRNAGVVVDCYAQGTVKRHRPGTKLRPDEFYAGLVAENIGGLIKKCYATCFITLPVGGGVVGHNDGGYVEYCLWDVEASAVESSAGGTGLTTAELQSTEVLHSFGWGGNPNWIVDDGNDYPRLIWERTSGTLIP